MKINFNGHFGKYQYYYKELFEPQIEMRKIALDSGVQTLIDKYSKLQVPYQCKSCPECGEKIEWIETKTGAKATNKCKYPGGYPAIKFRINIPSGKMVAGNDFRSEFPVIGGHDVNGNIGKVRTVEDYAAINLAHFFVGNTCPGIYQVSKKKFVIGQKGSHNKNPVPKSRKVGGICTDLWWVSIADHDEFLARGGEIDDNNVIECKPGVYEFTHVYHLLDRDDYINPQVYTTIEWVGDSTPLVDHKSEYESLNFTAEQIFHSLFRISQDFYGSNKGYIPDSYADGVSRNENFLTGKESPLVSREEWPFYFTAGRLLCTYGGGLEWHPNGWATEGQTPDKNEPEVEIPIFDKPFYWGQPCQYSGLSEMVKGHGLGKEENANPSFVRLGFNILQCILRYGTYEYHDNINKTLEKDGYTVKWAKEIYPLMVAKYGEPDFCKGIYE